MTDSSQDKALSEAEKAALEVMNKIPQDLHHVTITSLLPLLTVIMAHAQEVSALDGPEKKQLVLYCLEMMVKCMPFPEKEIIGPVIEAAAPSAIEGIIRGSRYAEKYSLELLHKEKTALQNPHLTLPKFTWPLHGAPYNRKPVDARQIKTKAFRGYKAVRPSTASIAQCGLRNQTCFQSLFTL